MKKKMIHIAGGFITLVSDILVYIRCSALRVYAAGDPWGAFSESDVSYITSMGALYKLFYAVGIMGCILTSLFYLIKIIFDPGDARQRSDAKSGITWKVLIAFLIFTAISLMGLVIKVIMKFSGNV